MTDPYALSADQQKAIIDQQLQQFRAERYGHVLNLARLEALPESAQDEASAAAIKQAQDAIATIEKAIDATLGVRDALDAEEV